MRGRNWELQMVLEIALDKLMKKDLAFVTALPYLLRLFPLQ